MLDFPNTATMRDCKGKHAKFEGREELLYNIIVIMFLPFYIRGLGKVL